MEVQDMAAIIRRHPFFSGLEGQYLDLISGCAKNVAFEPGDFLFHEGEPSDSFFVVKRGRVALQINGPEKTATFMTAADGEVIGLSWLAPPYRWTHDAIATARTNAIRFDASCLRGKSEADPRFGYELMKYVLPVYVERLHATRMQLLDMYG